MFTLRHLSCAFICILLLCVARASSQEAAPAPTPPDGTQTVGSEDTVRVESDLVDLNVTVISRDPKSLVGQLEQKDFSVSEDGVTQEISLFASAETPFDLVLLLDLSASTKEKLKLIRKTATNFVDAARPTDRIAVVTFTDGLNVVSPLTLDREDLKTRIKKIEKPNGGTNFWDALRYVVETMLDASRTARRSAVIVMTDGVDNALPDVPGTGSTITFAKLLEIVSRADSIVIPIYLDTEREVKENRRPTYSAIAYEMARQQLQLLAAESGSISYYARKVEDLKNVYQQVIRDLSTVYSIGYRPSNTQRDGSWRAVKVQLPRRPELAARTRRGYYAK